MKYAVRLLDDDNYEVVTLTERFKFSEESKLPSPERGLYRPYRIEEPIPYIEVKHVFKGRLADCESFIRLSEGGYM